VLASRPPTPRAPRRRIALGVVAATAAISFVVAVVALTAGDLVSGGSIGNGGVERPLFSSDPKKQDSAKDAAPQRTAPEQTPTTEEPPPTSDTAPEVPPSDTAPTAPLPETPPGEPAPEAAPSP
jgi:hypothetical protein